MFKKVTYLITIALITIAGLSACDEISKITSSTTTGSRMSREQAESKLKGYLSRIHWTQNFNQRRANIDLTQANLMDNLPDIRDFPLVVNPTPMGNNVVAELFVSTEKSGDNTDGWMKQAAIDFNQQNKKLKDGKTAQIAIRKIASGTGYMFIASGKARPDGFSPSNQLWVEMVKGHGVPMTKVLQKTVGNVAGIVMKKDVAKRLKESYQDLSVDSIIDAVIQGQLVMGYTNPYASSTGLNFLVTVLQSVSGKTDSGMLDPGVVSSFQGFQRGIPYVAMTTMQMRDSVAHSGALEAFVMEHQTFKMARPSMESEYDFIPFGIRHDNPLYALDETSAAKKEAIQLFANYLQSSAMEKKARNYGFDQMDNYPSAFNAPDGGILIKAQKIWKESKSAGRKTIAVFLADVSGSMKGQRINGLRKALKDGSDFISKQNLIGLVSFSDTVNVEVPPAPFSLIQKSAFYAAAEDLVAGGKTAIYDGVVVSLSLLLDAKKAEPDAELMLFVLSDGENTDGLNLGDVEEVVSSLGIPIYTIAYGEDLPELKQLSSLVEATMVKANEGNAAFTIGNLLNAQM